MKKIILGSFAIIVALSVAGCGKKGTITCKSISSNTNISGIDSTIEIVIDYEGKKVKNATGSLVFDDAAMASTQYEDMKAIAKDENDNFKGVLKDNKITNYLNKNDVIKLATADANGKTSSKKNKVIDGLKSAGYTCN